MARTKTIPGFHVVLLAGGSGTRFWPASRERRPKQFLPLAGKDPLLLDTWRRARRLAPPSRIWIAAPSRLAGEIAKMLPSRKRENLIVEPSPRNTAPAIALACAAVSDREPEAVVGIFPTDHLVRDLPAFERAVRAAVREAGKGTLVCLGVKPDRPATGFGYLKCAGTPRAGRSVKVDRFVEKPDARRASRFVRSGNYLWNGGMFVWKPGRYLEELDRTAPAIGRAVAAHLRGDRGAWKRATKISVDFAVMEKASGVRVVPLDAGWDDVGSWDAAARLRSVPDRGISGGVRIESPNSEVFGRGRMVALVDVPDVVVVDTEDALLVVHRNSAEKVREVVAQLRRNGRKDLL